MRKNKDLGRDKKRDKSGTAESQASRLSRKARVAVLAADKFKTFPQDSGNLWAIEGRASIAESEGGSHARRRMVSGVDAMTFLPDDLRAAGRRLAMLYESHRRLGAMRSTLDDSAPKRGGDGDALRRILVRDAGDYALAYAAAPIHPKVTTKNGAFSPRDVVFLMACQGRSLRSLGGLGRESRVRLHAALEAGLRGVCGALAAIDNERARHEK